MGLINNSREIINSWKEKFMEKPSRGLELKLNAVGIGVDWTHEHEDISYPEAFTLLDREDVPEITDEELADLI